MYIYVFPAPYSLLQHGTGKWQTIGILGISIHRQMNTYLGADGNLQQATIIIYPPPPPKKKSKQWLRWLLGSRIRRYQGQRKQGDKKDSCPHWIPTRGASNFSRCCRFGENEATSKYLFFLYMEERLSIVEERLSVTEAAPLGYGRPHFLCTPSKKYFPPPLGTSAKTNIIGV